MISSDLLREVLKSDIEHFSIHDNYLWIQIDGGYLNKTISIYQLAHKSKEWAFKQGYELFSRILSNDNQMSGNCLVIRVESDPETVLTITNADTEPEAIFKACEWIRTQIAS